MLWTHSLGQSGLFLWAAACAFALGGPASSSQAEEVGIAFWNVENLFDDKFDQTALNATIYETWEYDTKIRNDAKVIRHLNADIVGLCEVENRAVVRRLCESNLKDLGYKYHTLIEETDERGIDVALISKRPFLAHSYAVPDFPRGILSARFMIGGKPFYLLVNHWKSRAGGDGDGDVALRMNCARRLLEIIAEITAYEGQPVPIGVVGDLNDEASDASVQTVLKAGLVDLLAGLPPDQRWTIPFHDRSNRRVLHQGFDHVLANPTLASGAGGITLVPGSAKVHRVPFLLRKREIDGMEYDWLDDDYISSFGGHLGISDHLPVEFRVKTP